MAELGNRRTYSIIGRNDGVNDHPKTIFASDKSIAAIMLFDSRHSPNDSFYYSEQDVYLPIYFSDVKQIFGNSDSILNDLLIYQTQAQMSFLLSILTTRQRHLNSEEEKQLCTEALDEWLPFFNSIQIPTIMKKFNNQYMTVFIVENIGFLYYRDILELINYKYILKSCPICRKMFVKRDGRANFCPKCSADKKAIVDMLRNRGEDYNAFVAESYYYRDLIEGKEVSPCPADYDSSIQTKEQYEEWLKKKHKELTKRPKKHPAH